MISTILIIVIIGMIYLIFTDNKDKKQFNEKYDLFLKENDGTVLFCYTNKAKFCEIIENEILPHLDKNIKVIKLVGKTPTSDFDERVISHILCNIENIGFPNLMRVKNGKVIDISMYKGFYDSINNNKLEASFELINSSLLELRS